MRLNIRYRTEDIFMSTQCSMRCVHFVAVVVCHEILCSTQCALCVVALLVSMYFRCSSEMTWTLELEFIIQLRNWNCSMASWRVYSILMCLEGEILRQSSDHRSFVWNMNWVWSRLQRSTMLMMMLSCSLRRNQGRGHQTFVHIPICIQTLADSAKQSHRRFLFVISFQSIRNDFFFSLYDFKG